MVPRQVSNRKFYYNVRGFDWSNCISWALVKRNIASLFEDNVVWLFHHIKPKVWANHVQFEVDECI